MTELDNQLDAMKNELMAGMFEAGLLGLAHAYWMKRAEFSSRTIASIVDTDASNIAKGQISICYETADEIKRTLDAMRAEANAQVDGRISEKGLSAV